MTVCRALALATFFFALPLVQAEAQFGGMPGMPGGPGFGGGPGAGFSAPRPSGPPPECQKILDMRDETEKHGKALQAANKRKASPEEACKLFKAFISTETRFIRVIEENGARCGAPPDLLKQVRAGHSKAEQIARQVCEVAAQGPRPAGPSLSEALGASPTVPSGQGKAGTFDTLTGNVLAR